MVFALVTWQSARQVIAADAAGNEVLGALALVVTIVFGALFVIFLISAGED